MSKKQLPSASLEISEGKYTGPIPLASQMAEYGKISSDFPERILRMAEQEQMAHLDELLRESKRKDESLKLALRDAERAEEILKSNIHTTRLGMMTAAILTILYFVIVAICVIYGHPVTSAILGTGGIASLTFIYIMGSKEKK